MLAFSAETDSSGAKTARMEQRTTAQTKELIEAAAALLGINASEFTIAAAAKAARETIQAYDATRLTKSDHAAFLQALDETSPSADLVDLMRLHHEVTASK